jgi:integrase
LPEGTLWDWWLKILAKAEVTDFRIHDLRHGLATQAARHGASALLIRDLLGHKTLAMANRYVARVQDEALAAQRRAGATIGTSLLPEAQGAEVAGIKRPA